MLHLLQESIQYLPNEPTKIMLMLTRNLRNIQDIKKLNARIQTMK